MTISQYHNWFLSWLESYSLSSDLKEFDRLTDEIQIEVFEFLLSMACQAQNDEAIKLGKQSIVKISRSWVLDNIEDISTKILDLNDESEYRRSLELALVLNTSWLKKLVNLGLTNKDKDIQDTANEFKNGY